MNANEQMLSTEIYAALMEASLRSVRGQQAAEFRVGISDLGWCSERTKRMLQQQEPDDTDVLAAFIGTAIGDHAEQAVAALWPDALLHQSVTCPLLGETRTYYVTGHPDVVLRRGIVIDFKGLALDTPIPTPTGWTTMGLLQVGDTVFDRNGDPCRVVGKSGIKNTGCWEVALRNGQRIVCDDGHRWVVSYHQGRRREAVWTVEQMAAWREAGRPLSLPIAGTLSTTETASLIDPWVLGYWLGNGNQTSGLVTCNADDAESVTTLVRKAGWDITLRRDSRSNSCSGVVRDLHDQQRDLQTGRLLSSDGLRKRLADMGLLGDKHVPAEYLRGSTRQRVALLRGLMDSDGTWNPARRRVVFTNTNQALSLAVAELARSLGERVCFSRVTRTGYGKAVQSYDVEWSPSFTPFALPRKADKVQVGKAKMHQHRVVSVTRIESVPTQCITVDSPTSTYLCGEAMIPTHNTDRGLEVPARHGPSRQQQFQRHGYGLGAFLDGLFDPSVALEDVMVANAWIDRAADDKWVEVQMEPFNPEIIEEAARWLDDVTYAFVNDQEARKEPPREMCAVTCGFFADCRAYDTDVTGLLTDDVVIGSVEMYREGLDMEKAGRRLKDQANAHLVGITGSTGKHMVRWTHVNGSHVEYDRKPYDRLDIREVK